ncbi:MAG: LysR family transcriptional regulator, partial [Myxococcales bacterium]|nr:LysR family transcriptional regulator [Myxococcales bacterium]
WLPAFRAVGEAQHLPSAAAALGVSAPALSRTIKLLEGSVGTELFLRSNRRIELNAAGQALLGHLRNAMRLVDDGLEAVADSTFRGSVRVAASYSVTLSHVMPALARLHARYPDLQPDMQSLDAAKAYEALKKGELDVVFLEEATGDEELLIEEVDRIDYGVYASAQHPLVTDPPADLDLSTCARHGWVVPGSTTPYDDWPPDLPRNVRLRVSSLGVAIEACLVLGLLAHMPDAVGRSRHGGLHRVIASGRSQSLYAVRRVPMLDTPDRVAVLVEAMREVVAAMRAADASSEVV